MTKDLQSLIEEARQGLAAAQQLQDRYDAVGWQIKDSSFTKVRHMLYHLMKVTADVAALVENVEHALYDGTSSEQAARDFDEVMKERSDLGGELLFLAAQLANLGQSNLADETVKIYGRNAQRFAPNSEFADLKQRTAS